MAEYIEREAVLELGYWHGEHPDVDNPCPDGVDAVDTADIECIPTADVTPVVRCKDCKYAAKAKWNKKGYRICPASHMEITDDDFCSYAERRDT